MQKEKFKNPNRIYIQKLPIPDDFVVPILLESERFILRPLKMKDAEKDYEALISSIEHINQTRGGNYSGFITNDITLEDNTVHSAWCQYEFETRNSFVYIVMSKDENECLGNVYIYYSDKDEYDAEISMWVRKSEANTGLRKELYRAVKEWIENKWPFEDPEFLGKEE